MSFLKVIEKYGYPVISKETSQQISEYRLTKSEKLKAKRYKQIPDTWKFMIEAPFAISHQCCNKLKKEPFKLFEKKTGLKPFLGMMASESRLRKQHWYKYGCNAFDAKRQVSNPLMIWTEQDIQDYIAKYNLEISKAYTKGFTRTGCLFCGFGGFEKMMKIKEVYPKLYKYCMEKMQLEKVIEYTEKGQYRIFNSH